MSLRDQLAQRLKGQVVMVGVGNPLRGDDAAGSLVAQQLAGIAGARVIDAQEVPESYAGEITRGRPDAVLLIDAVDMGAQPGAVALLEQGDMASYLPTTHRLPLTLVMEFVRRETGADVFVLAVQPGQIGFGAPVSAPVQESVALIAGLLRELLDEAAAAHSGPREDGSFRVPLRGAGRARPGEIETKGTVQCVR